VARQYCGQLGKQDNCQIAVSLSLANHAASLPVAWRLYLPLEWTADAKRRAAAGIPETVGFLTSRRSRWSRSGWLARPVCRAALC
jgi:SRSO17 transposase